MRLRHRCQATERLSSRGISFFRPVFCLSIPSATRDPYFCFIPSEVRIPTIFRNVCGRIDRSLRRDAACRVSKSETAHPLREQHNAQSVILSAVGAHATTKSKDPEDAYCDNAASGNSLETGFWVRLMAPNSCGTAALGCANCQRILALSANPINYTSLSCPRNASTFSDTRPCA
jgi:hypothetical protein